MSNKVTEQSIKNKLGIKNWEELPRDKIFELASIFENSSDLDKETYIKILDKIPDIMFAFKEIGEIFRSEINESSKNSGETKNYYLNISNRLLDLLEKENINNDDKIQIFNLINNINSYIKEIDFEDRKQYKNREDKLFKLASLALAIVGGIMGVKFKGKTKI